MQEVECLERAKGIESKMAGFAISDTERQCPDASENYLSQPSHFQSVATGNDVDASPNLEASWTGLDVSSATKNTERLHNNNISLDGTSSVGFSSQSGSILDLDFAEMITAWPKLPEAMKAGMLAIVRTYLRR